MSCNSCKSNSQVNNVKWGVLIFGVYMFATSLYGSYTLIKHLFEFFK